MSNDGYSINSNYMNYKKSLFKDSTTIEYLRNNMYISTRTYNMLRENNCYVVGDICRVFKSEQEVLAARGIGTKTLGEIKFVISKTDSVEFAHQIDSHTGDYAPNIVNEDNLDADALKSKLLATLNNKCRGMSSFNLKTTTLFLRKQKYIKHRTFSVLAENNCISVFDILQFLCTDAGVNKLLECGRSVVNDIIYVVSNTDKFDYSNTIGNIILENSLPAKIQYNDTETQYEELVRIVKSSEVADKRHMFSPATTIAYLELHRFLSKGVCSFLIEHNCVNVSDIVVRLQSDKGFSEIKKLLPRQIEEIVYVVSCADELSPKKGGTYLQYFSSLYPFLNLEEVKFVFEYFEQNSIEPFLYILYKYMVRSNRKCDMIYCYFYGFYDSKPASYVKTGINFNVSRERVRQIVNNTNLLSEDVRKRFSSDRICDELLIDESASAYYEIIEKQKLPCCKDVLLGLLKLLGVFSLELVNGHQFLLNRRYALDFDCGMFVQNCLCYSKKLREDVCIHVNKLMNAELSERQLATAKLIAKNYLGLEVCDDAIKFKQTYIDYENEMYHILLDNKEPMLLKDVAEILERKYPDFSIDCLKNKKYDRNRIESIPIDGSVSKLYKADESKADMKLDNGFFDSGYDDIESV